MIALLKNPKRVALVCLIAFSALHLFIVFANHYFFRTFAYDYAIYNFAFYDFAHFRINPCPIYHNLVNVSFLQDHFSLSLIILSPLYWILNPFFGSYSLLFLQWLFIVWGARSTYKLIELKTGNTKLGLLSLLYYFILYGRYCSYQADCNLAIIGSALVPVFLYYFEKKKYLAAILLFIFLLFNREDFPLYLAFVCLGLIILCRKNKQQMIIAGILSISAVIIFILTFKYFIPALEDENKKFSLFTYSALGADPYEALLTILKNPIKVFKLLFINHSGVEAADWIKAKFYLVYSLSGGLLLLLRPKYLIFLIPLIAKKMLNDDANRWGYEMYYSIEVASILPVLVFWFISEIKNPKIQIRLASIMVIGATIVTLYCFSIIQYPGISNFKFNFLRSSFYQSQFNTKALNQLLHAIPPEAAVSSSGNIISHVSMRKKVYLFPNLKDADYAIVNLNDTWPFTKEDCDKELLKMFQGKIWKAKYASGNIVLFVRSE